MQDNPLEKDPRGAATPAPSAPQGGMPPAGAPGGALPDPAQRIQALTPQEIALLDQAFTPPVIKVLLKVMPELEPALGPFLQMQMQGAPSAAPNAPAPGPIAAPQSPLGKATFGG